MGSGEGRAGCAGAAPGGVESLRAQLNGVGGCWRGAIGAESIDGGARELRSRGEKLRRRCPGAPRTGQNAPVSMPGSLVVGAESPGAGAGEPRGRGKKPRRRCPGAPRSGQKAPASMPGSSGGGALGLARKAWTLARKGRRVARKAQSLANGGELAMAPIPASRLGPATPVSPMAHNATPYLLRTFHGR